jgi:sporulation and spore germination protein
VIPRHFQITISFLLAAILIAGIFIITLRHSEETKTQQGLAAGPQAPEAQGKEETIAVLVAYDEDMALRWRKTEAFMPDERDLRARAALRAVLAQYQQSPSPHPLASGADIKDVYLLNDDTLLVDTTAPFADGHPSSVLLEEMTLTSLIETLAANVPGITRVKFLVDGKERQTLAGHVDLMNFYQLSAVHELAKEFE